MQIRNALGLREGSAFQRGRLVGQIEKEMAWQAYESARKTREVITDARQSLKRNKIEDWSELSATELLEQLVKRKVITLVDETHEEKYSVGMQGISRRCLDAETQNE